MRCATAARGQTGWPKMKQFEVDPGKTKIFDIELNGNLEATFIGQAHFGGSGPTGRTCRECQLWHVLKNASRGAAASPQAPGYYKRRAKTPYELKPAKCHAKVPNKAPERIPHYASACRHFVENSNAPAARMEPPKRPRRTPSKEAK